MGLKAEYEAKPAEREQKRTRFSGSVTGMSGLVTLNIRISI